MKLTFTIEADESEIIEAISGTPLGVLIAWLDDDSVVRKLSRALAKSYLEAKGTGTKDPEASSEAPGEGHDGQ